MAKNAMTGEELGQKLLQSVREMKAGEAVRVTQVEAPKVVSVRLKTGLSQTEFAFLMGVSKRTLEQWEQGRRNPTGAACTLITIADRHPEILAEMRA